MMMIMIIITNDAQRNCSPPADQHQTALPKPSATLPSNTPQFIYWA